MRRRLCVSTLAVGALALATLVSPGSPAAAAAAAHRASAPVAPAAPGPSPLLPTGGIGIFSAAGSAFVSSFCYSFKGVNICVPTTILVHVITGNGKKITNQEAEVQDVLGGGTAGGRFCNWRIDWKYYDTNGTNYLTSTGSTHTTCDTFNVGRGSSADRTLASYGRACAVFYVNGTQRGKQCHNITS